MHYARVLRAAQKDGQKLPIIQVEAKEHVDVRVSKSLSARVRTLMRRTGKRYSQIVEEALFAALPKEEKGE